jgi:hypothetical protein
MTKRTALGLLRRCAGHDRDGADGEEEYGGTTRLEASVLKSCDLSAFLE